MNTLAFIYIYVRSSGQSKGINADIPSLCITVLILLGVVLGLIFLFSVAEEAGKPSRSWKEIADEEQQSQSSAISERVQSMRKPH